jgi:hypothetical protein
MLLTAALLGGCEFVTSTSVPPYMTYVVSELDVSGKIPDAVRNVDVISLSTSTTGYAAFIARASLRADNDRLLLVDDGFNLRVQRSDEFPARLNRSGIVTESDQLLIGNLLYDPAANTVSNTAAPENDIDTGVQILTEYYTASGGGDDTLTIEGYDASFIALAGSPVSFTISQEGTLQGEVRAQDYVDADGNRFIVLIVSGTYDGPLYVTTFPAADLVTLYATPQPLFSVADPTAGYGRVVIPGSRPRDTMRTREGIIRYDEDDDRLLRYDGSTGALLDSFSLMGDDDDEDLRVAFFARGGNYLLLDTERQILYEVAPWW